MEGTPEVELFLFGTTISMLESCSEMIRMCETTNKTTRAFCASNAPFRLTLFRTVRRNAETADDVFKAYIGISLISAGRRGEQLPQDLKKAHDMVRIIAAQAKLLLDRPNAKVHPYSHLKNYCRQITEALHKLKAVALNNPVYVLDARVENHIPPSWKAEVRAEKQRLLQDYTQEFQRHQALKAEFDRLYGQLPVRSLYRKENQGLHPVTAVSAVNPKNFQSAHSQLREQNGKLRVRVDRLRQRGRKRKR